MAIIEIGNSSDFEEGKGKMVVIDHKDCAVYRSNGELGCIRNECVHKGGSLCDGWLKDGKVVCPLHMWEFDFKTGKGFGKESSGSFRIWEEQGKVYADTTPMTPRVDYPAF